MFKTIFAKQLTFYMSVLVISFVILALAMNMAIKNYFVTQKMDLLQRQAEKISQIHSEKLFGSINSWEAKYGMQTQLNVLADYLDASLIIVNENGIVETTSLNADDFLNSDFNMNDFKMLFQGNVVFTKGNLGGIFSEPVLTVAYPIIIDNQYYGAIFLSSSMPELQKSTSKMFSLTWLCLIISGVLAFILTFILSRTMSKPLHEMNVAAKVISNGDFEKRIHVKSKDEVGQLAESFNNMAESLYEQEQLRRIFIANISHDLRSPLTSIRGFLQAILDGTIPPEKDKYYLNIVMDETERLSKLTHDIIDLNNIQCPEIKLDKTNFDINDLIRKTVLTFETRAINKNLNVSLNFAQESNIVCADKEKIERVLYNLIDNAIKFSQSEGIIVIETTILDKKVKVSVQDNGRGISLEDQKYVFDRFYKTDISRGEDRTGSGLGLSIVQAFLKAHKETITLKSEEGNGCTFIFELPLVVLKEKSKEKDKKDKIKETINEQES